jgi:zinc protease
MIAKYIACFALSGAALLRAAEPLQFPVESRTLTNGMKILVHEDHGIPNVALYLFFKVGARNERPGTTGLSHFFEHMMFNGAKKFGPKAFDRVMEDSGGSNNAYTSNDVTVYQDWFPSSALELIFDMEADRIRDLRFDPHMIESERGVVASERRTSVENDNAGSLEEVFRATAFVAHSYQWPVIGWMSDIESWTVDDLKSHFSVGYAPNNAVIVVAGNVKAETFFSLAEKAFAAIPPRDPPPPVKTKEPPQNGERRVQLHKFAQNPILMCGWHIPESVHPDYYALSVLQVLLLEGESSRLYKRLVDKDQLAFEVTGGLGFSFDPSLFQITVQLRDGILPQAVEAALEDELTRIRDGGVEEREMQKARNYLLAHFYRSMKTISEKANLIGSYEVFFSDYKKLLDAPEHFEKVSRDDVQKMVRKYFSPRQRTVATLIPDKEDSK